MIAKKSQNLHHGALSVEQILPRLVAAYEKGMLVPFLGAGMSVGVCTNWQDFITGLEKQAIKLNSSPGGGRRAPAPGKKSGKKPTSDELIRRGNEAVRRLKLISSDAFSEAVAEALVKPAAGKQLHKLPEQTRALGETFWPLVLTTNYDDLFLTTWNNLNKDSQMHVVGRKPNDCHAVLASLGSSSEPLLWALQGYLPGASKKCKAARGRGFLRWVFSNMFGDSRDHEKRRRLRDRVLAGKTKFQFLFTSAKEGDEESYSEQRLNAQLNRLRDELVVGHEEYRRVAYAQPMFRRAFAEVFRSRSFMFLGSRLIEPYFVNLFSEVLEIFGSNPSPHYAFVHLDEENKLDVEFLRSRLNIFVCFYKDHAELPSLLRRLQASGSEPSKTLATMNFTVPTSSGQKPVLLRDQVRVVAHEATLIDGEQIIVTRQYQEPNKESGNEGGWQFSPLTLKILKSLKLDPEQDDFEAVAAKHLLVIDTSVTDPRKIDAQFADWFDQAVKQGCKQIHVPWANDLSSDKYHQRFLAVSMFCAFGRWARSRKVTATPELFLHITNAKLLFDLRTRRIDPVELLRCDDVRFRVEVHPFNGPPIIEVYQTERDVSIVDIAEAMTIPLTAEWFVEVTPAMYRDDVPYDLQSIGQDMADQPRTISEIGVLPESTLTFLQVAPVKTAEPEAKAARPRSRAKSKKPPRKKSQKNPQTKPRTTGR